MLAQADSAELKRFGVEAGLTNYAAAYATGLLMARRLLTDLKMQDIYKGVEGADGDYYDVYEKGLNEDKRPFKAVLDVGLVRTTVGNRVFGALKGAVDGGLHVPHNTKRFPGFHVEKQQAATGKRGKVVEKGKRVGKFEPKEHRDHIFGIHVQNYMDLLKKEKNDRFKKQFRRWEAALTKAKVNNLEALYKKLHADIRKSPAKAVAAKKKAATRKEVKKANGELIQQDSKGKKWIRHFRLTNAERAARVAAKIHKAINK